MFYKRDGFIEYDIPQMVGISAWIPKKGHVYNILTKQVEKRSIFRRSPHNEHTFWEVPTKPVNYKDKLAKEIRKQTVEPEYVDPELQAYRTEEWDRRLNGFWFYNNGVATYITGLHYFYIAHWRIDIGLPSYREMDKEFFYALEYCIQDPDSMGMVEVTGRRQGKRISCDELLPTPEGFKKMINLVEGDFVFGGDGTPVEISYKSPIKNSTDFYRVRFNDGSYLDADAEHQWEVTTKKERKKKGCKNASKEVKTTKDLIDGGIKVGRELNYQIDIPKAVEYSEKELPIDPYLFGCWLGDGTTGNAEITNIDEEIIDAFRSDYKLTARDEKTYYLNVGSKGTMFRSELKSLDLAIHTINTVDIKPEKRIPEIYKHSSINQRLSVLQGIMDTDGFISKKGDGVELCTVKKNLSNDYLELIRSLGIKCSIHENDSALYGRVVGTRFRLRPTTDIPIFRLKRKRDRCGIINRTQNVHNVRRIISIEKLEGSFKSQCIEVKSDRGVYVVGKDYMLTHNTFRGGAFLYERASRTRNGHFGIQSKTLDDAKNTVFKKAVVLPWRRLDDFFKPVYDTGTGSLPKGELSFFPPSRRGQGAFDEAPDTLETTIDYRSGEPVSYDGLKLKGYFCDESGKSDEVDVYERHSVMEFCFMVGSQYVGKCLYSTTVEDMESGGASFKLLWDDSNQMDRDNNNRTKSGMYRYFLPAYKAGNEADSTIDKYGFPLVDKMKEFHLNRRENLLETNKKRYLSYVRKQPFTEQEAFYMDSEICLFDALELNKQLDVISSRSPKELYRRGNFLWEDGVRDGRVIFAERSDGKFLISRRIDPSNGNWNDVDHGKHKYPKNKDRWIIGCDPYDHRRVQNPSRRSDGASYGFAKYSSTEEVSEEFVFEYIDRPDTPEDFFEDQLMACHFLGCQLAPENNRPGIINYFYTRGYKSFVYSPEGAKTDGINANKKTHNELVERVDVYLHESISSVVFPNLLTDWLHLDIENTTKFDAGMAGGWTVVAAGRKKITRVPESNAERVSLKKVFPLNF